MKLNDQMSMVDVIKLLKTIAGDDNEMLDDIRKSLYNMAEADDLPDDQIDSWVKAYPEDKHESLRKLFAGPAVEVVKTKIEGGKDQPPADIGESPAGEQLAENEQKLAGLSDAEIDAKIDDILNQIGTEEPSVEPADTETEVEEKEEVKEEPEEKDKGSEEQDETTRNIVAGLSR